MTKWIKRAGSLCFLAYINLAVVSQVQAANDYVVASSGGDITGDELSKKLQAGNVTLQSSAGSKTGAGNIVIDDTVTWNTNNTLILNASNSVIIRAHLVANGDTAGLSINPNTSNGGDSGTDKGTYALKGASITLSGTKPQLSISGDSYTVINSLGEAGDASNPDPTGALTLQGIAVKGNLNKKLALGSDIDASQTKSWNVDQNTGIKQGFKPIGVNPPFTGVLDGLGHRIKNIYLNFPSSSSVGLFSSAGEGAVIRNLGLENANVTGGKKVSALVAQNDGFIIDCFVNSNVNGMGYVANLVGVNRNTILRSFAQGQVSLNSNSGSYVGSLAGTNTGEIQNSYATGNVISKGTHTGGLVGYSNGIKSKIINSYSTGKVTGSGAGGLLGGKGSSEVIDNYWNTTTSGQTTSAAGIGLTDAEMQQQSSYQGFDFTDTWAMVDGEPYPQLQFQVQRQVPPPPPTIISTLEELQAMQKNLAGDYVLGNDIDASASKTSGFTPIGTKDAPFTGSLDGKGFTISKLTINASQTDDVGLFGYTSSSSKLLNIGLSNSTVSGRNNVGALVGTNNGAIDNSYAEQVNITAEGDSSSGSGGLVGNNTGDISGSHSSGNLTGIDDVGGLVGLNSGKIESSHSLAKVTNLNGQAGGLVGTNAKEGNISASFASGVVGDVSTTGEIDGLVGQNIGSIRYSNALGRVDCGAGSICGGLVAKNGDGTATSSVQDSYATGGVNGSGGSVGGLVGDNQSNSTIQTSYATGGVSGNGSSVGGLVGTNSGIVTNGFWNSSVVTKGIGSGSTSGATGLTASQMLVSDNFKGFTITNTKFANTTGTAGWVVVNTNGQLQAGADTAAAATSPMLNTEYSTDISNAHQLQLMLMDLTASYRMVADVEAIGTGNQKDVWGTVGFVPIGWWRSTAVPFTGSFDGREHKIRWLNINRTDDNVGLFGYTHNASVSNVGLLDARVLGQNNVGALIGHLGGATVRNNYSRNGYVSGAFTFISSKRSGESIGGLIGVNNQGAVENCYTTGIAYGGKFVGGLLGLNLGTINKSYSGSNVNARKALTGANGGGLVGQNQGTISNTYATGDVLSKKGYGGLVGTNSGGTIKNSYAMNRLLHSPSSKNIGGLIGQNTGTVDYSYWDTTTSKLTTSAGGSELTDTQMKQQSSFTGWDFTNIWEMDTYPRLRNMPAP